MSLIQESFLPLPNQVRASRNLMIGSNCLIICLPGEGDIYMCTFDLNSSLIAPKQVDVCRNLGWEERWGVDEPRFACRD
jgi:hypothetical protein